MLWSVEFCEDIAYEILLFSAKCTAFVYQHALSLCILCEGSQRQKKRVFVLFQCDVYLQQKNT